MFWRFGGYANTSTLDTILDKPDVTLEELLDESDLIQELKQHNTKLIEYLRDENVLRRLLQYVVAPKAHELDDDPGSEPGHDTSRDSFSLGSTSWDAEGKRKSKDHGQDEETREKEEKARLKYAYIACEVLSSETWSISEALMENQQYLRQFWSFLKGQPALDPLQAGYFTKVNETLLDKKTEEMLDFFKSLDGVVRDMLQHVDCPMVMDLLLKIISLEKAEGGQGIVDWLHSQDLIPILLSYLSVEHTSATQTSAGDFLKAIITISANASQNEQSCIGPNDLTRQLVSEGCIRDLTTNMLRGGNPLTVGVGIIIEVIRKNNSDYDPDVGAGAETAPSSRDPIYLGTLLRMFAEHVPDFMTLILSPTYNVLNDDGTTTVKKRELKAAFGEVIEPLGFDRFKTCELMAELLHCSNMGLLNERGSEKFVKERDRERERLKAEGILSVGREGRSETDFTEDSTTYQRPATPSVLGSGSPEEIRKLEVANGGEEDGFEDVAASGDLNDEVKDDFDEKPELEEESNVAAKGSVVSTTHDEKLGAVVDSLDEPLLSPGLNRRSQDRSAAKEGTTPLPSSQESAPLSPTSARLTAQIGSLGFDRDNDTIMTGRPDEEHNQQQATGRISDASPDLPEPPQSPISNVLGQLESHRDVRSTGLTVEDIDRLKASEGISPHPEDHPAPLFAARTEVKPSKEAEPEDHAIVHRESQEAIDTTHAEEGDSSRSILMGSSEMAPEPQIETDADGSPVVGDFLKMMFVEHRVVPTILDFFFRFPWNNFLHNVVYDVVQQVFNGPMDRGYNRTLATDLFDTGKITQKIVEGQQRSDKAQTDNNMRLGYMGHLTLIAEEVVKFTERHPPEFLSQSVLDKVMHADWIDYVERILAETRERDNAILGGVRPDISVGPRQAVINSLNAAQMFGNGPSAALANAGLTGGGNGLDSFDLANGGNHSGGSFNLTGGTLLSGFGSSSDEEDEEMDEITEDLDEPSERAQQPGADGSDTLTLSNSPSTMDETFDEPAHTGAPPPPPPLNIPPSRARRQLAARLAMNKKKKEEDDRRRLRKHARAGSSGGSAGGSAGGSFGMGPMEGEAANEAGRSSSGWGVSRLDGGAAQHSSDDDDDDHEEDYDADGGEGVSQGTGQGVRSRARVMGGQRTTAAATRSLLDDDSDEAVEGDDDDDEDDDEEGEVVEIAHRREANPAVGGEQVHSSEEEQGGDLVEIRRPG